MQRRDGAATIALFTGVIALMWAAVVVLTGGVVLGAGPWVLASRNPFRALLVSAAGFAVARLLSSAEEFRALLRVYTGGSAAFPARAAAAASVAVFVAAIAWGSRAAGGSDSSCYVLQAEAFARGRAVLESPLASLLPDAPNAVFAPAGFLPSPSTRGAAVPICGAGLALMMAPAYLVHRDAVFLVVPATAALLVWLTFVFGRRVDDAATGLCAAVLLACSPVFLYQAVQPMSDVPAAALWMAALTAAARGDRRGLALAGACGSLAVLIRPNLAPIVLLLTAFAKRDLSPFPKRDLSPFSKWDLSPFLGAAVPAGAMLLGLNFARYGGLFATGYGDTSTLFSLSHVVPNLAKYPWWILETQTPFILLALAMPWWVAQHPGRGRLLFVSFMSVAGVTATYLLYTVFDDWWYARFLLPALPIVITLSTAILRRLLVLWQGPSRSRFLLAGSTALLGLWYLHTARARHAFDLQMLESRFAAVGSYANRALPANAVVLAVQHSASVRYHGRRDTLTWDAIPPDRLDSVVRELTAAGRPVYVTLEGEEDAAFRRRFAGQRLGALDWPPIAEIRGPSSPRIYDFGGVHRPR